MNPSRDDHINLVDEQELLTQWERICGDKADMHAAASAYYGSYVNFIYVPAVVVVSMCSIGNIAISSNPGLSCDKTIGMDWVILGLSSLGLLATATQTVIQALGMSDLAAKNENSAGQYEKLALEIRMQMAVLPEGAAFRSVSELIKNIKRQIDTLIDTSPSIPTHIEKRVANARIDHTLLRLRGERKYLTFSPALPGGQYLGV